MVAVWDRARPVRPVRPVQVKDALLKEEIHPNDRDPFQRSDRIYGPSIYTVLGWHRKQTIVGRINDWNTSAYLEVALLMLRK